MLGSVLDVFRLRQAFNGVLAGRDVLDGLRKDAQFVDAVRRAVVTLPTDRQAPPDDPFGPTEPLAVQALRDRSVGLVLVDPAGVGHGVPVWWRLVRVEPAVRLLAAPALTVTPRPVIRRIVGTAYRRMAFHDPGAVSDRSVRLFGEQLGSRERISRFLRSAHAIVDSFVPEVQRPSGRSPCPSWRCGGATTASSR